ncbi:radical SAM protein [Eggerthellaceae bacterium zg-887]|uniref:radical SAM/SPASM domain-containing protein n=1 Tax=Xiamenia xianingshaonis TaxID=2682776 RepID=UPI0013ED15FD|nr:radical SAM protein [Xiamenia xianingshaonis]NGM18238.1 radical SAM protein [Eggerthellaceae bacterium zg-893]NHM16317.1 radical SAM protein [Xiamenia xianingshaonis]
MKASYYNVLTENPLGEGYLLYNTLSKSLCELDKNEKRLYERIAMGDGDDYPLAADLADSGFVLENPDSEAAFLEYQYDRYKFNTQVLELVLATTLDCNNRCVYCYETPRPGYMHEEVQDAVFGFVREKYEEAPFKKLKVTWQGGEPLLRMDVIERLSHLFIGFCDEHGVEYIGHVISNGRLATEENAKKLAELRVYSVMTSLDGSPERHDCRRCTRSGEPSCAKIMANFDNLLSEGIAVNASFILERNNFEEFHEIGNELLEKPGMLVRNTQLRNYRDSYEGDDKNRIDLTTRPEYSDESFRFFMEQNPSAEELSEALNPIPTFCGTPLHNWWAIDELGNVYKCSGEYGDDSRVIFNLMEPEETRAVNWELLTQYMTYSPLKDEYCRKCSVLPLCQGECAFEHIIFGRFCRTFLYNIQDYVQAYYTALVNESEQQKGEAR